MNKISKSNPSGCIVNKFLLAGDKFMPEMHLRQPGFTYSACGPFTKLAILVIFIEMTLIKLVFNMIPHMQIIKIY